MDSRLRHTLLRLRFATSIHEAEARFDAFVAVVLSLPLQRRPGSEEVRDSLLITGLPADVVNRLSELYVERVWAIDE